MSATLPPIDPVAAERWLSCPNLIGKESPWLHEEVARRMAERLDFIRLTPSRWLDWEPLRGGFKTHWALMARYPESQVWVHTRHAGATHAIVQAHEREQSALSRLAAWFKPARHTLALPEAGQMDMLWANMQLHASADPEALLAQWHRLLAVDGFLMFSCVGPDTIRSLRGLFAEAGWGEPAQPFTDMHDWGDMLVHAGFAEPVMDMEHITLSFPSAPRLLQELRELGRNLAPGRFPGLRGRGWQQRLLEVIEARGQRDSKGALSLTFEIVYGHAIKPQPRVRMSAETSISLSDMREKLKNRSIPE